MDLRPNGSIGVLVTGAALLACGACGARTDIAPLPGSDGGSTLRQSTRASQTESDRSSQGPSQTDTGGVDAGCGAPASPRVLATFGTGISNQIPFALAVASGSVYVELLFGSVPDAVVRVPATGGPPERILMGANGTPSMSPFSEAPLVTDGAFLYMVGVDFTASGIGSSPTVTTYDLATGAVGAIPDPPGTSPLDVSVVRATNEPGAFYLTGSEFDPSTSDLVHWDGTRAVVVGVLPEWCYDLQIVGGSVFVLGAHGFYELPVAGGTASEITPVTFGMGSALIGANSTSVFYTVDGAEILRRTVATGATISVASVPGAALDSGSAWADDAYLYFGQSQSWSGLLRVPVGGGPVETFWSSDRRIDAVVTVGCEVFWLAGDDFPDGLPGELLVARE